MKWRPLLSLLLVGLMAWCWGSAAWIHLKAQLAQQLIARAWDSTLAGDTRTKPWPWADTWPVARLQVEDQDLYVLAGAQGNSLAFGPGHLMDSALPGEGLTVIGGHRDTHFRFLRDLTPGQRLHMQTAAGELLSYRITHLEVVDVRNQPLLVEPDAQGLLLVTCYPFDSLDANGPLRLLVWAEPDAGYGLIL
jgi:sortase A